MASINPVNPLTTEKKDTTTNKEDIKTHQSALSSQQSKETPPTSTEQAKETEPSSSQKSEAVGRSDKKDDAAQVPQKEKDEDFAKSFEIKGEEMKSKIMKYLEEQKQDTSPVAYPEEKEIPDTNIVVLVKHDHQMARDLYKYYQHTTDMKEKTKVRNTIIRQLVQHDECEQTFMYPSLKDKGDTGNNQHDRSLKEHQELRELLYPLRKAKIEDDPSFDTKFKQAIVTAFTHMELEEKYVLPMLQEQYSEDVLEEIGGKYKKYKPMFATRPHPDAPKEGTSLAAANILTSPFDKLEDLADD